MDENGSVSRDGVVRSDVLSDLLTAVRPVLGSSLARERFSAEWLTELISDEVSTADGARTLIELTVTLVAEAIRHRDSAILQDDRHRILAPQPTLVFRLTG